MAIDHLGRDARNQGQTGYTMVEILVVAGIIAVMSAIAIPGIGRYLRNYQIRGAAQQVAAEIQAAKLLAVKKNVNFGVVFVVLSETTYQYFMEDKPLEGVPQDYADAFQGAIRTLPSGVAFTPGVGVNDAGFRFNRLGAMCDPDGSVTCPDLSDSAITPAPTGNYVSFVSGSGSLDGAHIDFSQPSSGLTMTLVVNPGGRVTVLNK
jgi:prepilin-type N-terminal cleavage/methylation domain-containing protein